MSRKAVFVDRDGTINRDCPYCHDPKDLKIYEDTANILKRYQEEGYLIIIVTNQSGINRGYLSEEEFNRFQKAVLGELDKRGVHVVATYHCPHTPWEGCSCRKPNTGLIEQARKDFDIDLRGSVMIGDNDATDGELAKKLGIKCIILDKNRQGN